MRRQHHSLIVRGAPLKPRDMFLAALTSVTWGLAFVAIKFGVESFSAPQLLAIRFVISGMPFLFVPRPRIGWRMIAMIGATWFAGQFLLLFFAFEAGMPAGLASIMQQMQVFFTVLLSAICLGDVPTSRQAAGILVALPGLALIGLSTGGDTGGSDLPPLALVLALGSAFSWSIGNVLVKRLPGQPLFPLIVWASLVPPLPALAISAAREGPPFVAVLESASWIGFASAVYLGVAGTGTYVIWGDLLQRYPAAVVAPFALLSPCTGVAASALIFGEAFSPIRYAGMALILAGLAVIVLPGCRRPAQDLPSKGK
jgi:O-acetylserine/cysteine efflux transporter